MKKIHQLLALPALFAANASAHTSSLPHAHPHANEPATLIFALAAILLGLFVLATWFTNKKSRKPSKESRASH